MKSVLISIKPEWVAKILSGEKTVEIRRTAPKCELPVEAYVYCAKSGVVIEKDCGLGFPEPINGRIVAKFTILRADEFDMGNPYEEPTSRFLKKACVTIGQARTYANGKRGLYAWRIYNPIVFDEPKELSEFGLAKPPRSWYYMHRTEENK